MFYISARVLIRSSLNILACYWIDCGGGTCNKTSLFSRECLCEEGYYNLFNSSAFPCYHQCKQSCSTTKFLHKRSLKANSNETCNDHHVLGSIGADCPNLGLNLTDPTTSDQDTSPTSANDNSTSTSSKIFISFT